MRTAQSRQKSYADQRRRDLEFAVGDHVFVKVAPMKGVMRFGKKGKLSPRFIGPFEILDRVGTLAYRVALPPNLAGVHNVFHVSMLRKYMANPSHVLNFEPLQLTPNLSYEERPVQILDRQEKKLRNKLVKRVKVKWLNHSEEEATWESEPEMRSRYPELFDQRRDTKIRIFQHIYGVDEEKMRYKSVRSVDAQKPEGMNFEEAPEKKGSGLFERKWRKTEGLVAAALSREKLLL
ncbi:uncharacterized protein LOC142556932 [Primulina tabacum]|uniref:uncharacterized protein LOC142556932 n=1 Tax=Primulina tabacum TaxID=48773 RepID=UPI003F59FB49